MSLDPRPITAPAWDLRDFGSGPMIMQRGGHCKVVLCSGENGLETCGSDGILEPLAEGSDVAKLVTAAPMLLEFLSDFCQWENEPDKWRHYYALKEMFGLTDRIDRLKAAKLTAFCVGVTEGCPPCHLFCGTSPCRNNDGSVGT